ncbi:alpha/beta fold hydrolase [Amphibiibacter pelophylacis]|uniref:Alpha/beta fold hydrolase n=1 Tax=Amphibiibacter pelophylacis TaxID=1799477 RepID=A0ACC6P3J9_9BURK
MAAALPLVLLPGTLCNASLWQRLSLPPGVEALTPDCRYATSAADAARLVLARAPQRFALAGMSMGGATALEIVAQAPQRVLGLALISSHAGADLPGRAAGRTELLEQAREHGLVWLIRDKLWSSYVHPSRLRDRALQDLVVAMALEQGLDAYAAQLQLLGRRTDHHATLSAYKGPVLIAAGRDDALCPPPLQTAMLAACPQAEHLVLAQCGHLSPLEAPIALGQALGEGLGGLVGRG